MVSVDDLFATQIAANLTAVRSRIASAAMRVGRSPGAITLVAVSKTHPFSAIAAAMAHGQQDFGENRLEELWDKAAQAEALGLAERIRWHMIGNIQSRKTNQAIGPIALIHAVDRVKIAERLSREAQAAGCTLSALFEVNMSGEESKHGFTPAELRMALPHVADLPGLSFCGLMTMAPLVDDPEDARPVFRSLRLLRDELALAYPHKEWRQLSMGMTNDFEIAIEEGATIVRIGSAIFGSRTMANL